MTTRIATVAYAAFLILFSAFKYFSAAPPAFNVAYAVSVVVLVLLTGIIPYFLARFVAVRIESTGAMWIAALVVALVACCAGYAGFLKLFIEPQTLGVAMQDVALRGIYAGPVQGVLAAFYAQVARK